MVLAVTRSSVDESEQLREMIDFPKSLNHLAIIMDGNGRWANSRGLVRTQGHKSGINSVREMTTTCAEAGLERLTLYALSVENFVKRPRTEVVFLLSLLKRFVVRERSTIMDNNISFDCIGRLDEFPVGVRKEIDKLRDLSASNDGMRLTLALNYGGRTEITDAVREIALQVAQGEVKPEAIDEAMISRHLYDPAMTDPDLLIRTGGHMRISNFLLWQVSYSEIFVTDTLWPDFGTEDLSVALEDYSNRRRKFGGLIPNSDG